MDRQRDAIITDEWTAKIHRIQPTDPNELSRAEIGDEFGDTCRTRTAT